MQDFNRLNYDSADDFDLKGSYALAKYVMHRQIDDLTVPNLRATLHANAKGSEVSAVAGSVSILGGIALSAMSIATAGWTLAALLPVAGIAASAYVTGSALNAISRYNAESNLLAQTGMSGHLEHLQDLLDRGVDPRVIAHDVQILMIHALAQNQKIVLKELAYGDQDILLIEDEGYEDEGYGNEGHEDEGHEATPLTAKTAAPQVATAEPRREAKVEPVQSILDRETVLGLFCGGIFTPRIVTGESQVGKTSFVNEFAIEAKKQGMKVWLLNLGYSDESPLLSIADRTCIAGWKYAAKAAPADRKSKIKEAIQLLQDFALESETLLIVDELSTLYLNEALDEVRESLQSTIDEHSIDGRKRRCGIVMCATPLPPNKDRDKAKLTGVESVPFIMAKSSVIGGFTVLSSGVTIDSHKKGLDPSTPGVRFVQMPDGQMVCVDLTSVERKVTLSNVFDPLPKEAIVEETYAVGIGLSSVQVEPSATIAQRPSSFSRSNGASMTRGDW